MHQYNVCCQDAWYILSGLDIQLEQSENKNPALRNLVEGPMKVVKYMASHILFFSVDLY